MKHSMHNWMRPEPIETTLERLHRYGYDGIEISGEPARHNTDEVRALIAFRRLNLIEPWPFKGLFDAIFCRNVLIYFDNETKASLVDRFVNQIRPGGWLYLGHSESLIKSHPGLRLVGRTIYRREV